VLAAPYWASVVVLAIGVVAFLATSHHMARGVGERSMWSR